MYSGVVIILALFALGSANEDCSEERVQKCLHSLLSTLTGDVTEDEVCKELRDVSQCLRSAADDCLGEDREAEVDEGLKELDDLLSANCPDIGDVADEENTEAETCLQENTDYLMECMSQGTAEALKLMGLGKDVDINVVKCSVYSFISACVVTRTEEKCGEEVGNLMKEELEDAPQEIKDACAAAQDVELTDFESLLTKKK